MSCLMHLDGLIRRADQPRASFTLLNPREGEAIMIGQLKNQLPLSPMKTARIGTTSRSGLFVPNATGRPPAFPSGKPFGSGFRH